MGAAYPGAGLGHGQELLPERTESCHLKALPAVRRKGRSKSFKSKGGLSVVHYSTPFSTETWEARPPTLKHTVSGACGGNRGRGSQGVVACLCVTSAWEAKTLP